MPQTLFHLHTYRSKGVVNVVVETPRGSQLKLTYDEALGQFTVSHGLLTGLTYPYDWGFIPGTRADDGDPVDALVLHEASTFPGVVLPCRVVGMVEVREAKKGGKGTNNNRVIAIPTWDDRLGALDEAQALPKQVRKQLEGFFISATFFTGKKSTVLGWRNKKDTERFIRRSISR